MVFGLVAVLGAASAAKAELTQLDSASFLYKYEMDVAPSTEDQDSNGTKDFALSGASGTFVDGICTLNHTGGSQNNSYYISTANTAPNSIWPVANSTHDFWANGFTIEARIQTTGTATGTNGVITLMGCAYASTTGSVLGQMDVGLDNVGWGYKDSYTSLATGLDNTSAYHNYRFAMEAGGTYFDIWRDNTLLTRTTGGTFSIIRSYFGQTAVGYFDGTANVDYFRFTPGAYAPAVPEPVSAVLLVSSALVGLAAYAWRKRRR